MHIGFKNKVNIFVFIKYSINIGSDLFFLNYVFLSSAYIQHC